MNPHPRGREGKLLAIGLVPFHFSNLEQKEILIKLTISEKKVFLKCFRTSLEIWEALGTDISIKDSRRVLGSLSLEFQQQPLIQRHRSARSVFEATLWPILPKIISDRRSLELTDVILECDESASVLMLDSRFAKIQVCRSKALVN